MLSRVADSIYWMSRYIERAENVARFIDVNSSDARPAAGLARTSGSRWWSPPATTRRSSSATASATHENVIQFLAFDPENPNSIFSCLRAARENARTSARHLLGNVGADQHLLS